MGKKLEEKLSNKTGHVFINKANSDLNIWQNKYLCFNHAWD